jgi:cytoskeleton protein RodZ
MPSGDVAMDIGLELQEARKRRGLSIEQLAALTKIRHTHLRALESNDFDHLPGTVYTRGFVKAYAREVGLDPGVIVARYAAAFEHPPDAKDANNQSGSKPRAAIVRSNPLRLSSVTTGWRPIAVALLLLWLFVSFLAFQRANSSRPVSSDSHTVSTSDTVRPREIVGTSGSLQTPVGQLDVFRLELHTTGPCWLAGRADGGQVVNRLMAAGERQTIEVRDEIVLRIGDPAAFEFSINGISGRRLGDAGEAVTVRITSKNYATFMQ